IFQKAISSSSAYNDQFRPWRIAICSNSAMLTVT
ncbi:hypothetical protein A2U01_0034700, partial [Trifolium medium]|nr:hypothetical protein [Trifolium medium]